MASCAPLLSLVASLLPLPVMAAVGAEGTGTAGAESAAAIGSANPVSDFGGSVVQMIGGLMVVLVVLLACLWLIKRLAAPRGMGGQISVLGAASVGPRERVVLVRAADEVLLLGVAPGSVRTLHVMDASALLAAEAAAEAARQQAATARTDSDFARRLRRALARRPEAD